MRKIIDSNSLRSPQLRKFLSKSPKNIAVFTDYAAMEAYSGQTLAGLYRSIEVVADFPKQVEILKGTGTICALRGRPAGLRRRMIDRNQTKEFSAYVRGVRNAQLGDAALQRQLLIHSREARNHLDEMLVDVGTLGHALFELAKTYSKEERRSIRDGEPYSEALIERMITDIVQMAAQNLAVHPNVRRWPKAEELINTFVLRYCLCGYLVAMDWFGSGGAKDAHTQTLRNDLIDANFAAYGTFFDGVMTNDEKLNRIFEQANTFIGIVQRGQADASQV